MEGAQLELRLTQTTLPFLPPSLTSRPLPPLPPQRRDLFPVEIIELSCVLLDAHSLEVRGEFQAYVRPTEHPLLDPFCVELTGIEQAQVRGGEGVVDTSPN